MPTGISVTVSLRRSVVRAVVCIGVMAGAATHAPAQPLPLPWTSSDIGAPSPAGRASESSGTFSVSGGGNDIWSGTDKFQFVYQPVDGDLEIVARVVHIEQVHQWSRAGVMIREALTTSAAYAFMLGTAAKGWAFQGRQVSGGPSVHSGGASGDPPGWVRLVRSGDVFSGYESTDGSNWVLVSTETIPMPQTVFVGLAVTSHSTAMTSTATFTNVTIGRPTHENQPLENQPPSVTLTAPATGTTDTAPATLAFSATASDADGSVSRVDFYANGQLVGSATTSPYGAMWNNVPEGRYDLTAVATDNAGATASSATATVTVKAASNQPPTVSITSPASGATFTEATNITVTASAADGDGTVVRVDFYEGPTYLIGSDTTSPYSATWSNLRAGNYELRAVAVDNAGASTTSAPITVSVTAALNTPPTVSITSPASGATFTAPATILVMAAAADGNGTVTRVDFYAGTQLIGTQLASPYIVDWSNVAAGTYVLTAVARDNSGASTTSPAIIVTVTAGLPPPPIPTSVAFTPSTDHDTGVTSYSVTIHRASDPVSATPVAAKNLGKPTPFNNEITSDISDIVNPLPAGPYYAVVWAWGPGGSAPSAPSATFTQ